MSIINFNSRIIPIRNIIEYQKINYKVPIYAGPENVDVEDSAVKKFISLFGLKGLNKRFPELYNEDNWREKKVDVLRIKIMGNKKSENLYSDKPIQIMIENTHKHTEKIEKHFNILIDAKYDFVANKLYNLFVFEYNSTFSDTDTFELFNQIQEYNTKGVG